jgi:hypothetical protein
MAHHATAYNYRITVSFYTRCMFNILKQQTHQSSRQEHEQPPSPPPALHNPLDSSLPRRNPEVLHVLPHHPPHLLRREPPQPPPPATSISVLLVTVVVLRVAVRVVLEPGGDERPVPDVHAAPAARGYEAQLREAALAVVSALRAAARHGAEPSQERRRVSGVLARRARGLGAGDEGEEVWHGFPSFFFFFSISEV